MIFVVNILAFLATWLSLAFLLISFFFNFQESLGLVLGILNVEYKWALNSSRNTKCLFGRITIMSRNETLMFDPSWLLSGPRAISTIIIFVISITIIKIIK
jgi:hypothetical protein